jgi:hypothetical protein
VQNVEDRIKSPDELGSKTKALVEGYERQVRRLDERAERSALLKRVLAIGLELAAGVLGWLLRRG